MAGVPVDLGSTLGSDGDKGVEDGGEGVVEKRVKMVDWFVRARGVQMTPVQQRGRQRRFFSGC